LYREHGFSETLSAVSEAPQLEQACNERSGVTGSFSQKEHQDGLKSAHGAAGGNFFGVELRTALYMRNSTQRVGNSAVAADIAA
jgi:hypothetical protein